ncbi:MAG: cytochrome D ubiquinol oxidase subunit II [Gammaproteobacteria bacterium SG8_15]|nr:MAG: cytochrome D ubiquinol oxidase subunit II [Gammaproteobacteria bacterium SG8_15]
MKKIKRNDRYAKIPKPASAQQRQKPLPWHRPKSPQEDADAPHRIRTILESPSYRQADQDVDFLKLDETRGVRLQIDYQKPEFLLEKHGIKHTIVVFGSTRLSEPGAAESNVAHLRTQLDAEPDNHDLRQRLDILERILAKSHYYDVAREFGRLVGQAGKQVEDGQLVIMTGGGPGIMEAANRGAYDVESKSIGLNINLPHEQYPNPYITPDLCFRFHYFALRKLHFLLRTRALVVFPGGYGTFDELFETLTLVQTRKIKPIPVILVGETYWKQAFNVDFLVNEGVIDEEDRDLFWYAETAQDIWNGILRWHEANGTPLIMQNQKSEILTDVRIK